MKETIIFGKFGRWTTLKKTPETGVDNLSAVENKSQKKSCFFEKTEQKSEISTAVIHLSTGTCTEFH